MDKREHGDTFPYGTYLDGVDLEAVNAYLRQVLTPKRYRHSLGVIRMATLLASIHGADPKQAYLAALLHDAAKCESPELMNRDIRRYGLSPHGYNDPALTHAKLGAAIAEERFGVHDPEVLAAIASHTTGRSGMSLLEEIVYVSDAIEPGRDYAGLERLQALAKADLDAACLEIMDFCIETLSARGRPVDQDTLEARRFIRERFAKGPAGIRASGDEKDP